MPLGDYLPPSLPHTYQALHSPWRRPSRLPLPVRLDRKMRPLPIHLRGLSEMHGTRWQPSRQTAPPRLLGKQRHCHAYWR